MANLHGTDYTHCMYIVQRREVECGLGWSRESWGGGSEETKPARVGYLQYLQYELTGHDIILIYAPRITR